MALYVFIPLFYTYINIGRLLMATEKGHQSYIVVKAKEVGQLEVQTN
jgi:hypothetical protein